MSTRPRLDRSRCLRMRYRESQCDHCRAACPSGAVDLNGTIAICEPSCTGCLTCTTVCPSGALEGTEDPNLLFRTLSAHPHPVFVLGCRRSGACHHRVSCLGVLSLEHFVALYAGGEAVVQLDATACNDCPSSGMRGRLSSYIEELTVVGDLPLSRRFQLITDPQALEFRDRALDRRSFFSSLKALTLGSLATALTNPAEPQPSSYREKTLPARRRLLLEAFDRLSTEERHHAEEAFCFTASFSAACDGCMGCARVCPTAALSETEDNGDAKDVRPFFSAVQCTGCGLCEEFCLSAAVTVSRRKANRKPLAE